MNSYIETIKILVLIEGQVFKLHIKGIEYFETALHTSGVQGPKWFKYRVSVILEPNETEAGGFPSDPRVVDGSEIAEKVTKVSRLAVRGKIA